MDHSGWMVLPAVPHRRDLTYEQWALSAPSCPGSRAGKTAGGAHGEKTVRCSTASSGSWGPELHGRTFPTAIRRIKRVTGDFSTGCAQASCEASSTAASFCCRVH